LQMADRISRKFRDFWRIFYETLNTKPKLTG
jgi:hypothetical protein